MNQEENTEEFSEEELFRSLISVSKDLKEFKKNMELIKKYPENATETVATKVDSLLAALESPKIQAEQLYKTHLDGIEEAEKRHKEMIAAGMGDIKKAMKVSRVNVILVCVGAVLIIVSAIFLYYSVVSKQQVIDNYEEGIYSDGGAILSPQEYQTYKAYGEFMAAYTKSDAAFQAFLRDKRDKDGKTDDDEPGPASKLMDKIEAAYKESYK